MIPLVPICVLWAFLITLPTVAGHGFIHDVLIGGVQYPGWNPFTDPYTTTPPTAVRKVLSDGPVPTTAEDLPCGSLGDNGTALVVDATSGSQVSFNWVYWPGDHQGPVSTYMASCNGNCETFSASNAQWFKIDAEGYDPTTKQWAAAKLIANGFTWTSTIPAELAPGQYLMRNEIVALHSVTPQFYPSCTQINLTGSGKGQPSASSLVSIPALYDGVVWPDIYTNFGTFTIPGPPPVTFDTTGGGKPAPATTAVTPARPTTTAGAISSTSTTTPVAGTPVASGHCQLNSRRLLRRRLK